MLNVFLTSLLFLVCAGIGTLVGEQFDAAVIGGVIGLFIGVLMRFIPKAGFEGIECVIDAIN